MFILIKEMQLFTQPWSGAKLICGPIFQIENVVMRPISNLKSEKTQWKLEQNALRSTYIYNAYQQSYDR